jgi:hypothetical protein
MTERPAPGHRLNRPSLDFRAARFDPLSPLPQCYVP